MRNAFAFAHVACGGLRAPRVLQAATVIEDFSISLQSSLLQAACRGRVCSRPPPRLAAASPAVLPRFIQAPSLPSCASIRVLRLPSRSLAPQVPKTACETPVYLRCKQTASTCIASRVCILTVAPQVPTTRRHPGPRAHIRREGRRCLPRGLRPGVRRAPVSRRSSRGRRRESGVEDVRRGRLCVRGACEGRPLQDARGAGEAGSRMRPALSPRRPRTMARGRGSGSFAAPRRFRAGLAVAKTSIKLECIKLEWRNSREAADGSIPAFSTMISIHDQHP